MEEGEREGPWLPSQSAHWTVVELVKRGRHPLPSSSPPSVLLSAPSGNPASGWDIRALPGLPSCQKANQEDCEMTYCSITRIWELIIFLSFPWKNSTFIRPIAVGLHEINNYYLSGELTWNFSKKISIRSRRIGADGRHLNFSKFLSSLWTPLRLLFSCHFLPPLLFFPPFFSQLLSR